MWFKHANNTKWFLYLQDIFDTINILMWTVIIFSWKIILYKSVVWESKSIFTQFFGWCHQLYATNSENSNDPLLWLLWFCNEWFVVTYSLKIDYPLVVIMVSQLETSGNMSLGTWKITDIGSFNSTKRVFLVDFKDGNCVGYFLKINTLSVNGYLYFVFWYSCLVDDSLTTGDLILKES